MPVPPRSNSNGPQATAEWALDHRKSKCNLEEDLTQCTEQVQIPLPQSPVIRLYFPAIKQVSELESEHHNILTDLRTAPQLHESQSFLTDPANKLDITSFVDPEYKPFNDNTARQFWYLVIKSLARWFITAGLCAGYVMSTIIWSNKPAISENQKKIYNAITTAISIALGLNIASAFKDMALNMRWPILASKKRPLRQVGFISWSENVCWYTRLI